MLAFNVNRLLQNTFNSFCKKNIILQRNILSVSEKSKFTLARPSEFHFLPYAKGEAFLVPNEKLINATLNRHVHEARPPVSKLKGPVSWKTVFWVFIIGGGFSAYVMYLQEKRKRVKNINKVQSIGKALIGGSFDLVNQYNVPVSSDDLSNDWLLIYFGFTHCPDICPDEIEKMVKVVEELEKKPQKYSVKPLFITVDPERDTPEVVGKYVKEFSDKIIGLTGTMEQISRVCKAFRVYFSAGPRDEDNDYIVDHSIVIYFVGPNGEFLDYFTQTRTIEQIVYDIEFYMAKHESYKARGIVDKLRKSFF